MYDLEEVISILDVTLNTRRKRHIVGGLAFTTMTIKQEDIEDEE